MFDHADDGELLTAFCQLRASLTLLKLKMEAGRSSETPVHFRRAAQRYIAGSTRQASQINQTRRHVTAYITRIFVRH